MLHNHREAEDQITFAVRKKPKTSEIIEHAKRLSFNDTEYLIENKVFNQDIVLYAKSQNSKQK